MDGLWKMISHVIFQVFLSDKNFDLALANIYCQGFPNVGFYGFFKFVVGNHYRQEGICMILYVFVVASSQCGSRGHCRKAPKLCWDWCEALENGRLEASLGIELEN